VELTTFLIRYGGQLLARREYDPVSFFVIYIAIVTGGQAAGQALSFTPSLAQATGAANRIFSLRHGGDENDISPTAAAEQPLPQQSPSSKIGAGVELRGVSFQYATRDTAIYHGLNVTIESGQFVAFVGPSGCGKTTVISLLERFYEPTAGTIYFNGQDIRSIELSSYRRSLSLVAQEPRLFEGSIRENLLLGLDNPEDTSEEQLIQACKDAEIHDFVVSLPEGYGTELGIQTQTALSGGQKQRVCIARALLRNPSLLLLDEATSSLDSQSEKLVQAALNRLAGQRRMTIVAVAHRLATIQKADMIFVFSGSEVGRGSRIVEKGNHQELLRRRGIYWQMVGIDSLIVCIMVSLTQTVPSASPRPVAWLYYR
jgi:ATP-binding cassette subfamily B (MDR/TAP) protein 1